MKRLSTFILFLTISVSAFSQILSGTITNYNGEIVPYATVYIEELRQGTTASAKGVYALRIPAGSYNITYQSMGYGVVYDKITITTESVVRDVELPMQYYTLPEVRVTSSGEDPAYSIMRKAIGMAPYYLNYVQNYSAEVYLRGNLTIQKMPKIIQNRVNKEIQKQAKEFSIDANNLKLKEGDVFFSESYNEINFTAPNNYVQRVISVQNSFPIDIEELSIMDYVQTSFYEPMIATMAISPLAPQALSYYNFKFLGATEQGNLLIDKIEVTPKRKNQQLFTGEIYIIEGLWALHSLDLVNENFAGTINIKQIYVEVEKDVWLPVSNQLSFDAALLGVWANFNYSNSTQYTTIALNHNLSKPITTYSTSPLAEEEKVQIPENSNATKIAQLLDKEDLTNREMNQLSKLMEQEAAEALLAAGQNVAAQRIGTTKIVDDDAFTKSKEYWEEVRTIPLTIDERALERALDTTRQLQLSSINSNDTTLLKQKSGGNVAKNILLGNRWDNDNQFTFNFGGLLNANHISFNTVDGFLYGFDFGISQSFANSSNLSVSPFLQYAFGRKKLLWGVDANYNFNDSWKNSLSAAIGTTSADFNGSRAGIHPLVNTFSSLFFKENNLKLFEKEYAAIKYSARPYNSISFSISANYANRTQLANSTSFAFFGGNKQYTPNIPNSEHFSFFDHQHFDLTAQINFKPGIRYLNYNDIQFSNGTSMPSFTLEWQHGVNITSDQFLHYNKYRVSASMRHDINFFSSVDWSVAVGGMINSKNASFVDISHFNIQEFPIVDDKYSDMFLLPTTYSLSTPNTYVEGHVEYTATQIILKYLPIISNTIWRENLNLSFLATKNRPFYFEVGYSLSEILFVGQIGVFVGFNNLKYNNMGVKLIFRLDYL